MPNDTVFKTPFDELLFIMDNYKAPDGERITRPWLARFYRTREGTIYKWFQKGNETRFDAARLEHLKIALQLTKPMGRAIRIRQAG